MRTSAWFSLLIGAAICGPSITHASIIPRSAPISGRIISVRGGETAVLLPSSTVRQAEPRQDLKAGDILRTNSRGTLSIVFADRTQIRLGRNSVLRVNVVSRGSPSSLTLQRGRAWGRTSRGGGSNLSVDTPAATAGIRGTEWAISADEQTTSLQVFDGEVELFNDQGRVSVAAGQAATAVLGRAPTRVQLVNPVGREQMMYFVALEDGLDLFSTADVPGLAAARRGDWQAARDAFASAPREGRVGAIADFGNFVADIRLGTDRDLPEIVERQPVSFVSRAFVQSFIGELGAAIATADEGLARYPDEMALYEIKARAALLLGDDQIAREAIDAALARHPENAAALALRAEISADYDGQPYRALDEAQRAVALDPERPASLATLSDIRLERSADREALAAINRAIALDPDNPGLQARRATILLSQNRTREAHAAIEQALTLDPTLSIVRTALAEYYLRVGDPDQALEEGLAGSADNPAYSRALLQLAEIYYGLGDSETAVQQFDAADRLDPMSPLTPLARAALALHDYRADDAIRAAREAVGRFRARGGVYSSLSENRETGSLVSRSFRFLDLENWGRYYGDRVFDAFTPSSYFDQALNRTPDPFVTRLGGPSFNPKTGTDFAAISSFLQGMTLEPLEAAYSERRVQFANEAFSEYTLGAQVTARDGYSEPGGFARIDGIANRPVPVGYSISIQRSDPDPHDDPGFLDAQNYRLTGWFGTEFTPYDRFVFFGRARRNRADFSELGLDRTGSHDGTDGGEVFGFYTHSFGHRNNLTLGGGIGRQRTFADDVLLGPRPAAYRIDPLRQRMDFDFASVSYTRGMGRLDLAFGAEAISSRFRNAHSTIFVDLFAGELRTDDVTRSTEDQQRIYADVRYVPFGPFILQGQISYVASSLRVEGDSPFRFADLTPGENDRIDYRIGAAYEPVAGQWLRVGAASQTSPVVPFTFAPVDSVGLRPNIAPSQFSLPYDSYMARWDAEWSDHLFTSVDYQHQSFDRLLIPTSDGEAAINAGDARIDRIGAAINLWLTGNLGISANYAYADSSGLVRDSDGGLIRAQIPYLPRHFGRIGISWTHPARISVNLSQSFVGGQRIFADRDVPDFSASDIRLAWEPWDRRLRFELNAYNLFDKRLLDVPGLPSGGREIFVSARIRF